MGTHTIAPTTHTPRSQGMWPRDGALKMVELISQAGGHSLNSLESRRADFTNTLLANNNRNRNNNTIINEE